MEALFIALTIIFGLIGFLSPCTWNLNAILVANAKEKGFVQVFYFIFFRTLLFSVLGFLIYLLSTFIRINIGFLIGIHLIVGIIFLFGSPLMKRYKIAPFDLSIQALFPNLKLPAGIALGLNFPYCAFPYFILVSSYGLYLDSFYPFLLVFIFAAISGIPSLVSFFLSKESFKAVNQLIPVIPYVSGVIVIITGLYLFSQEIFGMFSLFDFVHREHSLTVIVLFTFLLGVLTSTGPSTLPFLPVIAGILVSSANSKIEVIKNVFGFTLAFIISHIIVAVVAFYGFIVINKLFNVQLFSVVLGILLIILGLNFLGIFNFSIKLPNFALIKGKGFFSSFILGTVYTFSICPSCTGFLLGAVALAVSTKSLILTILVMLVYAVGRSVVVFLFGFLFNVNAVQQFISNYYTLSKRFVGAIFIVLAVYFIQKGF